MARIIPLNDYPVRPFKQQGESTLGFVYRFLASNGHTLNIGFYSLIRKSFYGQQGSGEGDLPCKVKDIFGDRLSTVNSNWHGRPDYSVNEINMVYNKPCLVKICPICVKSVGFHYACWEISSLMSCPLHNCYLIDRCTECGWKFRWAGFLTNWRCCCGEQISEMAVSKAGLCHSHIATLLLGSSDLVLPTQYNSFQAISHLKPYTLLDSCSALLLGCKISHTVLKMVKHPTKQTMKGTQLNHYSQSTVAWVAKNLTAPEDLIMKQLVRLLDYRFTAKIHLICINKDFDMFLELKNLLTTYEDNHLIGRLSSVFDEFLNKYELRLSIDSTVFIKPKYVGNLFNEIINNFDLWWGVLASDFRPLNQAAIIPPYPYRPDALDELIFKILRVLLKASWLGVEQKDFIPLTHRWHIPDSLKNPTHPSNTLFMLCDYLKTLPYTELYYVHFLVRYCYLDYDQVYV